MDRNRSYRNSSEYPKGTVKSFRDIKGYSKDRMGTIRDRDSCRNQSSPRERMTFPRDKPRSFRETTDLSWDEMGFSQRGYPGTDIGYPRMCLQWQGMDVSTKYTTGLPIFCTNASTIWCPTMQYSWLGSVFEFAC